MDEFSNIMIVVIWFGVALTLATGLFYTPNYRVRRRDNPKEFWTVFATSTMLAVIATILILRIAGRI